MTIKTNYKCLLIKTNDREFFTHQENYPLLVELSNTFDAEISVVKAKKAEVLEIKELASAFCDNTYRKLGEYRKLKAKPTWNCQLKSYIQTMLLSGQELSIKALKKKYRKSSLSSIYNNFNKVKKELEKEGFQIKKLSCGCFKI